MGPSSALSQFSDTTFPLGPLGSTSSAAGPHQVAEPLSLSCPVCQRAATTTRQRVFQGLRRRHNARIQGTHPQRCQCWVMVAPGSQGLNKGSHHQLNSSEPLNFLFACLQVFMKVSEEMFISFCLGLSHMKHYPLRKIQKSGKGSPQWGVWEKD